jgi:protein O-GlcNAc transferase
MPSSADTFAMASRHLADGNLLLAEELSWSIVSEEPCHADALHLLGLIEQLKGNWATAHDYLNRSLLCNGANALTWHHLGDVHLAVGELGEAIANYEQAVRLCPDFGEAHHNLGIAWQRLGEWARSANCLQEAIRLMACPARAYNNSFFRVLSG